MKILLQKGSRLFAQISTLDEDRIYEFAKKERVNLVTTACTDQALLTAANVSEKLGLSFILIVIRQEM